VPGSESSSAGCRRRSRARRPRWRHDRKALDAQLRGVDARHLGIDPADPGVLAGGADLGLATEHGFLDVRQELVGVDYAELRRRAQPASLGAEPILVAHVDDLIAMKLRAGRPIDQQDIAAITAHERTERPAPDSGATGPAA
jgi:hypothetical protein